MAAAAEQVPFPPTYRFRPTKRELVTFYLLPRARGQDPFPGVLFEDDAAGSTLPWDLFERHGVGSEDEAYFIVRASEAAKKPGARQDRGCDGGVGIWKMQSSRERSLRVRGEKIKVHVSNLNLHMGKGKNSGSVGWVMHEYTIAAPPCPSPVKICHIAFSGHGRKRMRVPDGQQVYQSSGHARVGATASALPCSGATMLDHGSGVAYASGDSESAHLILTDDDDTFRQGPLLGSSDLQCFPSAASEQYPELEAQVPTTEQQDIAVPQQLSAGELEFWSSIGVDVQSNSGFEQEQATGVQSGFEQEQPTGVQSNFEREQPTGVQSNFEQEQPTGVQSSWVAPNNGIMVTGVQSSWVVPNNDAMATGVQSSWAPSNGAMTAGIQSRYVVPSNGAMATGIQSTYLVPNNSAMAGDFLDDFCRSILGKVPTNCAARDSGKMATRTLGGSCSLIC